jgi:hypothetical protein
VSWSWAGAGLGAVYAVPALVACLHDPTLGLALAVGVLPAAILPLPPRRRARVAVLAAGVAVGLAMLVGSVLALVPVAVTAALLAASVVGAAVLSGTRASGVGRVALVLGAPMIAVGLSFDVSTAAVAVVLLAGGACYAWLASLAWPDRPGRHGAGAGSGAARTAPGRRQLLVFGAGAGTAAALAYLVASIAGWDHPGWAPAACLLVARPDADALRLRSAGRIFSVIAGGIGAVVVAHVDLSGAGYAAVAFLVTVGAAATRGSHWYVTPAFTSFFVLLLLLIGDQGHTTDWVGQRTLETLIGVTLALACGHVSSRFTPSPRELAPRP